MKEDILEQIVEDWQLSQPKCFVKHNIKYRPDKYSKDYDSKTDSVHSDIDILSININDNNVSVFNCKSWLKGFNVKCFYDNLNKCEPNHKLNKITKHFREFIKEKWQKAFIKKIEEETNSTKFTYYIVCTKLTNNSNNEKELFENSESIKERFKSNGAEIIEIKIITLSDILDEYSKLMDKKKEKETNYPESAEVGRLLQLIKSIQYQFKFR